MEQDFSKFFLFVVLSLVVLVLVTAGGKRPLAAAPLDGGDHVGLSDPDPDAAAITRGPGWIGVPNYDTSAMPLALMTPIQGAQPVGGV